MRSGIGLLLVLAACSGSPPGSPSALLITLDTTRADALSCCGAPAGLTPALDGVAREGIVYEQARTVAPITLPAHASMLTGLYPPRHAVHDNGLNPLPAAASTLAERAREEGIRTGAFVAAAVLDAAFGLDQGFEVYEGPLREARAPQAGATHYAERPAQEVVRSATQWLRGLDASERFFLWVHFFEPHAPYRPGEAALARAGGDPYRGEVALTDDAVAVLLDALRELGRLDDTFIVVVGDHGEGLGEHGESTHTVFCYDTTLRVPFLVRDPSGQRAGERSEEIVSVVDVHPTLIEALGLGDPGPVDGVSLHRRRVPEGRGAYFESYYGTLHYGWAPLVGWVDAAGKSVHGPQPEFFVVRQDPREQDNRWNAHEDVRERHRAALQALWGESDGAERSTVAPELLERLEALGYATTSTRGALPDPLAPSELADPRSRREELKRFYRALEQAELGRRPEAIRLLESVVADNPRNASARQYLAEYLVAEGECERAVPLLEALIESTAERASNRLNLGFCLARARQNQEAAAQFERALELDPGNAAAVRNLMVMMKRLGRPEEVARYRARLEALGKGGR